MKKLPVGIDDFRKIRENDYYYVDKTNLIREIIDNGSEVTLFTRPRRFGKILNMSMLKEFQKRKIYAINIWENIRLSL